MKNVCVCVCVCVCMNVCTYTLYIVLQYKGSIEFVVCVVTECLLRVLSVLL